MPTPAVIPRPSQSGGYSTEDQVRALVNILEDATAERERLKHTQDALLNILDDSVYERVRMKDVQRAMINILEDATAERQRLKDTQDALLNILDDSVVERSRLQNVQKAMVNILEDFNAEKNMLRNSQSAVLNILDDFSADKVLLQNTTTAMMNILEDFSSEKNRLQDMQRGVINILEDLQEERSQLIVTQKSLQELTLDLENRVRLRTNDLTRAYDSLQEQATNLQKVSRFKSDFLANMSHELRTPLNSVLILAKLLFDNPERNLSEKQTKFAQTILRSGTDLLALINDVLDLSKIEAGKMRLELSDIVVDEVLDQIRDGFRPLAALKQLEFKVDRGRNVPDVIHTDRSRLDQVLKNLLSNAFKFTQSGHIRLRLQMRAMPIQAGAADASPRRMLQFSVVDTGIGIPEDKQQIIFEAFQQADGSTSRQYGGTGLGLSISSSLAGLLGGILEVDSTPGRGSCFTLTIPEKLAPQP